MSGMGPAPARRASVDLIKSVVASHFSVAVWMFAERRSTGDIVLARQVVMDLLYRFTTLSNVGIAKRLGDLDHSTVVHGRQKVNALRRDDWQFELQMRNIERELVPPEERGPEVQLALFIGPLFDEPYPPERRLELAA